MSSSQNYVSVFLGNGDGIFPGPVNYTAGSQPMSIVAADFDRDGSIDIAVLNGADLSVLLGNGDGTFKAHKDYLRGHIQITVKAADLSDTGISDFLVTNSDTDPRLEVLRGNGNGTFQPSLVPRGICVSQFVCRTISSLGYLAGSATTKTRLRRILRQYG